MDDTVVPDEVDGAKAGFLARFASPFNVSTTSLPSKLLKTKLEASPDSDGVKLIKVMNKDEEEDSQDITVASGFPTDAQLDTDDRYRPSKMFGLLNDESCALVRFEFDDYPGEKDQEIREIAADSKSNPFCQSCDGLWVRKSLDLDSIQPTNSGSNLPQNKSFSSDSIEARYFR